MSLSAVLEQHQEMFILIPFLSIGIQLHADTKICTRTRVTRHVFHIYFTSYIHRLGNRILMAVSQRQHVLSQ